MEGTRSGLRLLAASARPRAGVLLAGCAVLVAVLGAVFARQNPASARRYVGRPVTMISTACPSVTSTRCALPGATTSPTSDDRPPLPSTSWIFTTNRWRSLSMLSGKLNCASSV